MMNNFLDIIMINFLSVGIIATIVIGLLLLVLVSVLTFLLSIFYVKIRYKSRSRNMEQELK